MSVNDVKMAEIFSSRNPLGQREIGRDIRRIGFGSGGRWFAFDEQSRAGNKSETACMHSRGLQFQTLFRCAKIGFRITVET